MENRAHALAAGLFVVVLSIGLVLATIWFTGDTVERVNYLLASKIPVSGLNPKAPVRLRGVDVGRVEDIEFDPKDRRIILVSIAVERTAPISRGTYAQFAYLGVTGLSYVQLDDDGNQPEPLPTSDSAPGRIEVRPSLFDQVGVSGQQLIADASQAAKRIAALLNEQNVVQFSHTLGNLEVASERIAGLAEELRPAVRTVPALAARADRALQRADSLFVSLSELSTEVQRRVDVLDRVSRGADKVSRGADAVERASDALENEAVNRAFPKLYSAIDDLSRSSHALNQVLFDIHSQPQSLIFGRPPATPGPGEPGFSATRDIR
jgi:phospholipid/cholesterol/gamma-HCH transport system substrate-binding protein